MEELDIEGIKVLFPFKPYDIQLDYMKSIIKCLKEKNNCLLESPTGTGKTLCILCSTIAWIESNEQKVINKQSINDRIPRVFYSSRTHSQLSQTVRQLKQTPYKSCQSVVIASRDQLCLNSEVKYVKGSAVQSLMCRQLIKEKKCHYYADYEQKIDNNIDLFNGSREDSSRVLDIEDLVDFGKRFNCCPYYGCRHLSKRSSLVFTPYNYILDPQIRRNQSINLNNCVVIFDEGHNIEKICEECMSTQLTSETLSVCLKHINTMEKKLKKIGDNIYTNKSFDKQLVVTLDSTKVNLLKTFVINFQKNIFKLIVEQPFPQTQQLFKILEDSGLNSKLLNDFLETINQIRNISINNKSRERGKTLSYCSALNCFYELFEKIFPNNSMLTDLETYETHKLMFCRKYKIFGSVNQLSTHSWTLYIWCLSPSIGVKALTDLGIYNMIITSGTLAPIHSFETEMEIEFPIKLENSHVIKNNQLLVLSISKSKDDINLSSNFYNRMNTEYFPALGQTLIEILPKVPKGVLIFFSSYGLMKNCINYWTQNNDIWDKMTNFKHLFVETNDKMTFNDSIIKYKQKIDENDSKGAVFFGVCRGKLSEGIDLPNDYCRSVIMTGLPFPSVVDPRVKLKKQYLNEAKTKLSADSWYSLQMKRALNQSIGRVVRHKDDFGVIILLDSRFATLNNGLSKWIENFIYREYKRKSNIKLESNQTNFNQKMAKIKQFFSSYYRDSYNI